MFLFNPNFLVVKIFETVIFLFFLISYLLTMLINPGIPNRDFHSYTFSTNNKIESNSGLVKCSQCNIITPKSFGLHHCDICNVCVMGYDHHCPWTGKCIGKYNIVFFYCFLFSLLAYIFMSFITFLMFVINLQEAEFQNRRKIRKY